MTAGPVYIASAGVISPLGNDLTATEQTLKANVSAIAPLNIFPVLHGPPLPVGQISTFPQSASPPRTHQLAREAARQVLSDCADPPDAVILGCTTGGILTTETLLRDGCQDKSAYRYHGLASVASDIANQCHCRGPAIVISTACSSSAVAIALALRMLRQNSARRILVGGVDSLSRLTYFGFHSLQLVDRHGCKPLDAARQGIAVAEGAAMLMLTTIRPPKPLAILLGAGLSCDAYHPAAPHPEGKGALQAMQAALQDAHLAPADIDYINLHGTGTLDNDLAEAKAVRAVFANPPRLSSIKGASGHSLATAGALEAVVACLCLSHGFIPANTGCTTPDPALQLSPQREPLEQEVRAVLSNSFGFGGNNGSLVLAHPDYESRHSDHPKQSGVLAVHGSACLTGAGLTQASRARLAAGDSAAGRLPTDQLTGNLPPRSIRRVKRLARISLLLSSAVSEDSSLSTPPSSVFMGTGWGALSETYDFLGSLTASQEQFPSPTDFVGSVHNSPASQIAISARATGPNITVCGGDYSFEQALLAADALLDEPESSALLLAADEGHDQLSRLLDPSISAEDMLADGGGALHISRQTAKARCLLRLAFYQQAAEGDIQALVDQLGGPDQVAQSYAAVLIGMPAAMAETATRQQSDLITAVENRIPVVEYRKLVGQFASASAVAAALAAQFVATGILPGNMLCGSDLPIAPGKRLLILGCGDYLTAMEMWRP